MRRAIHFFIVAFGLSLAAALPGCAAGRDEAGAPAAEWRVLVKLVQPGTDGEAIAARARRASGLPVRYVAAVSPQWHALALACGDEARCTAAMGRLQADTAYFESVQRDERRRPQAPGATQAQPASPPST